MTKTRNKDNNTTTSSHHDFVNIVAEREALAKLINIIDSTLERKQLILDAIYKFHDILEQTGGSFFTQQEDFKKHYDWLQDSLRQTNQALEAAIVFQQVMYGKIYTGLSMLPERKNDSPAQMIPSLIKRQKWELSLRHYAKEIGSEVVRRITKNSFSSKKDEISNMKDDFLSNTMTSAVSTVLTADLLSEIKCETGESLKMRQSSSLPGQNEFPQLPEELNDVINTRRSALDELGESLKMLQSELTLSTNLSSA